MASFTFGRKVPGSSAGSERLSIVTMHLPGKLLVGGRVIDAGGGRPAIVRTLARNLFKAVMLYAPILAIFALLSPGGQGIGEVVSRTFVATRTPPSPGAEPS